MAVIDSISVSLQDVSVTAELRLDSHYYSLLSLVKEASSGIEKGNYIRYPIVTGIQNGQNLPQSSYASEDEDSSYLYASVGAFSQFAIRLDECQVLRNPKSYNYPVDIDNIKVKDNEVIVTRSGTPGIAWAVQANLDTDCTIIPSGFVIRVQCDPKIINPVYLSAIFNHPFWRIWTSASAAGKRQRNLSQEHLSQVVIPDVSKLLQEKIACQYIETLEKIEFSLTEDESLTDICDEILLHTSELAIKSLKFSNLTCDFVSLADCAKSSVLRLDSRFHRNEVQKILHELFSTECILLEEFLVADVIKNSQPKILAVDEDADESRVIATSSIQAGQIIYELTKPTTQHEIDASGEKIIQCSDILVTLDGEGSIGKAAVFMDDYDAVTDSHIGILRLRDKSLAISIACFLNSSYGQAQFYLNTSGATGQTQVSKMDLMKFRVPRKVIENSDSISSQYLERLKAYQPLVKRVRHLICESSALTSSSLLGGNVFDSIGISFFQQWEDPIKLFSLLEKLKPSMF